MKRPRNPLPENVEVGALLQRICCCGKKRGRYVVTRVGGGRKEAWALPARGPQDWPRILRWADFKPWGSDHFAVLPSAQPSASRDAPKEKT